MSIITDFLLHKVTSLSPTELQGITAIGTSIFWHSNLQVITLPNTCKTICWYAFAYSTKLVRVVLPKSVERIGSHAFESCTSLSDIVLDVSSDCIIHNDAFKDTPYYSNATSNLYSLDQSILVKDVTNEIPETVINFAGGVGANLIADSKLVIPDRIQIISGYTGGSPTTMIIGSSARYLGTDAIPTAVTTLVCRQPQDMFVELPKEAGEDYGLSYNKNSRSVTIYTDNTCMKNYNWSGDNITATILPLSSYTA